MKEIKDLFSLVGGPLKASTKSHILASTSDIYDEFWGTYLNVINEYNSNPLDAFLVQNKGIITEIIDSTKIQTLTKTTLNVGDLCLGIYKDDTLTNSKYDYSEGEYLIPGYKSVYFTITEISNDYIAVSVEKDEIKPNTIFAVIGNTESGINFSLNTENLKAEFINVKDFKIEEDNIKNISGKFTYNGVEYIGTLLNKIYTSNSIGYLNNAPSLNSAFKSNVFTRNPDKPSVPTGGKYDNPIPVDVDTDGKLIWSDGIPDGNAILWASTRIFSSDEKYPLLEVWTEPKQMTDMADFKVEFSSVEDSPGDPANNPGNWANTADESTIWMATSTCKNGVWSAWQISKIKGEKGNDGTSISILGSARKVDVLPTELGTDKALLYTNHLYEGNTHPWIYLWNKTLWEAYSGNAGESYLVEGNLYVWDGDSWENAGSFKGDKGESAYIHIKYAKQDDGGEEVTLVDGSTIKLSFTDSNGEVPGLYLGLKPDNIAEDSKNITDYTWAKWKGEDGFGYEYIYIGTEEYKNPGVPESKPYNGKSPNDDDYVPEGWSDNPVEINSKVKYCWMCHRQKVDGKWSNYKGVDDTLASLWAKWSEDGNGIVEIKRKYLVTDIDNVDTVKSWGESEWSESSPAVNSEDIYLWEWIQTEYTSGDKKNDYAIIGRMGDPGIDGKYNEYVYCLSTTNDASKLPNIPDTVNTNDKLGEWTDDPQSVSETWPYQWISEREYDPSKKQWGEYSTPVLWNIWAKGENSVHLDLDNEMDSFLYDGNGNLLSNIITTTPTLYDGLTPVTEGIKWEVSFPESEKNTGTDTFYSFNSTSGVLTVNKMSAAENTVVYSIIATYKDAEYVSSLTIKKLVGVDKYDLVVTPNSITYNTSIGDASASTEKVNIKVYRTSQGEGRKLITNLNSYKPIKILVDGTDISSEYLKDGYTFAPDYTKSSIEIDLEKDGIIVDTETIPINKSKDGVDGSAIRLDLSNENDSMLYDGAGTLLSGNVISIATLYNGTEIIPNDEYGLKIVPNGCTASLDTNTITVSAISATSANVEVVATYKDVPYTTNLNIKKLVGVDKYDLAITPNSIAYNTSTTELSSNTINIGVYRTSQSEGRKLVTNLSKPGLNLKLFVNNQNATNVYNSTGGNFSPSISSYITGTDIRIVLKDSNDVVLDSETIPINKSKNGENGTNGANAIRLDLDNENDSLIYDEKGNLKVFTPAQKVTSQARLYEGGEPIDASKITWGRELSGIDSGAFSLENGLITVTGITSNVATAKISAQYDGGTYYATLSIKKIINADKYEIICSPNSITHNLDEGSKTYNIGVSIYKTDGSTGVRSKLSSNDIRSNLVIRMNTDDITNIILSNNSISLNISSSVTRSFVFELRNNQGTILDSETVPVGYTKNGAKGESSIKIDLDNDNDSIMYNNLGEAKSTVVSQARLYDGVGVVSSGVTWSISNRDGASGTIGATTGAIEITAVTKDVTRIEIEASYNGKKYYSILSIKKLTNTDKYEIICTPNSIAHNKSDGTKTYSIQTNIYKTDATTGERYAVNGVPDGFTLTYETDAENYGIVYDENAHSELVHFDDFIYGGLDMTNRPGSVLNPDRICFDTGWHKFAAGKIRQGHEQVELIYFDSSSGNGTDKNNEPVVRFQDKVTLINGTYYVTRYDYYSKWTVDDNATVAVNPMMDYGIPWDWAPAVTWDPTKFPLEKENIKNTNGEYAKFTDLLTNNPQYTYVYPHIGREFVCDADEFIYVGYVEKFYAEQDSKWYDRWAIKKKPIPIANDLKYTFNTDTSMPTQVTFILNSNKEEVLDSETVPVNYTENGFNSVSVISSPLVIVAKKSTSDVTYKVDVTVMDGTKLVENTGWSIDKVYNSGGTALNTAGFIFKNLQYAGVTTTTTDSNTRTINLKLAANASVETSFSFDVIYNKVTYKQKIDFKTVGDGETAVTYEIIPTNAYYILDQNNAVSGAIEGILYKITGDTREIVKLALIECGYSNTIDTMAATTDTDDTGYFKVDSEQYFNDDWQDPTGCAQNSNSIIARYKLNNQIVAQYSVSLAKSGLPGEAGKQSAPLRVSEWAEGTTYYTGYDDGDPWSDVVYTKDSNSKPVYYRCIKKNNTRDENLNTITPTNTLYWTKFDGQFESVATGLLLAENAHISLLSGNVIEVTDSLGNVKAGLAGKDDSPIWAGTDYNNRANAPFRVTLGGHVYMGDADVRGVVKADSLYRSICMVWTKSNVYLNFGKDSEYVTHVGVTNVDGLIDLLDDCGYIDKYEHPDKVEEIRNKYPNGTSFIWKDGNEIYDTLNNYNWNELDSAIRPYTGNADVIFIPYESSSGYVNGFNIYIPEPSEYEGKLIEIHLPDTSTKTEISVNTTNGGTAKISYNKPSYYTAYVSTFTGSPKMLLNPMYNNDKNGFDTNFIYVNTEVSIGDGITQFYSDGNYWIKL